MLKPQQLKYYLDNGYKDCYLVEYTVTSVLPKHIALQKYASMNRDCVDKISLYKLNGDNTVTLIDEKG